MSAPKKDEGLVALLGCVGVVAVNPLIMAHGIVVNGYLIYTLWAWFAVPLLGAPSLTFWGACGISVLASALRSPYVPPASDDKLEGAAKIYTPVVRFTGRAIWLLSLGYVLHRWFL